MSQRRPRRQTSASSSTNCAAPATSWTRPSRAAVRPQPHRPALPRRPVSPRPRHGRQFAEESGLTPGAITTVVDRWSGAATPTVCPTLRTGAACWWLSPPSRRARSALASRVRWSCVPAAPRGPGGGRAPPAFRDFLRGTRSVYEAQIAALTAESAPGAPPREGGVKVGAGAGSRPQGQAGAELSPAGQRLLGRLEFTKGAAKVSIKGDPALSDPGPASSGPVPEITVIGSTVVVQQRRRFRPFDWRAQSADFVALDRRALGHRPAPRHVEAGRRPQALRVTSLEVTGGASDIEVRLPRRRRAPSGTRAPEAPSKVTVLARAARRLVRRSAAARLVAFDDREARRRRWAHGAGLRRVRRRLRPLRWLHLRRQPGDGGSTF